MFTYNKLESKHAGLLSKLSTDTFVRAYGDIHSQEDMQVYCQKHYSQEVLETVLSSENTDAVVAFYEGEPAGFYLLNQCDCPIEIGATSTELKQIYVMPDFYGIGLGHSLFVNAARYAESIGNSWLWLCVSDRNHRARAFYDKLNFASFGAGPTLIVGADQLSSTIMALKLMNEPDSANH